MDKELIDGRRTTDDGRQAESDVQATLTFRASEAVIDVSQSEGPNLLRPPSSVVRRPSSALERVMSPVRRLVNWLSARPTLWNLFRRILELNFREEKRVIARELMPQAEEIRREGRRPQLLDLGCGTGELAPVFLKAGYNYTGIDIAPERIAYAAKTYRKGKFHVMDASALQYPDGHFDQILVTGVLHHLSDEEVRGIVKEMRRVLRPEGRALVMEDIALRGSLNLLGALVHLADAGAYIRRPAQYVPLLEPDLQVQETYPVRCGVCDYQAFILMPS
ncbi:MAG TPA: class I SAM-dependent methyltransferase [Chloroflexia bacterium]|nr:class I SAM-dependent methyltransferase [Chloroflexia bacterium]